MTILGKDLVLKENDKYPHIQILLKTQKKKTQSAGTKLLVFGTNNFVLCPIKAYKKYQKSTSKLSFAAHKQIFRTEDGKTYTGKMFNADLKA